MSDEKNSEDTVLSIQKIIGSSWWITIQMLYLMGKFADESCIFLPIQFGPVSEEEYTIQTEISQLVTLTWYCDQNICKFQAPLTMKSSDFFEYLKDCISSSKRLSVIPIKLLTSSGVGHANMLIYDKSTNTLERFEPHGQISLPEFNPDFLDASLPKLFEKQVIGMPVNYISPQAFCPRQGPQVIEEIEREKLGIQFSTGKGLCSVWSFIYANLRLTYPDKTSSEIIEYINSKVSTDQMLYKYAENIIVTIWKMSEKIRVAKSEEEIQKVILETIRLIKI